MPGSASTTASAVGGRGLEATAGGAMSEGAGGTTGISPGGAAPVVCRTCGATTNDPKFFVRRSTGLSSAYTCRPCVEAKARRGAGWTVASAVLLGIVGLWMEASGQGMVQVGPRQQVDYGAILLFSSLLYLCSFVHVVPHELGHALVGKLTGFHVLRITVGVGSPLVERRVGSTSIDIRAFPVGGLTYGTTSARRALRTRLWLFAAGGPAATIAVTVVAWRLALAFSGTWAGAVLAAFTFAGVVLALGNLFPYRSGGQTTDGWKLLTTPFMSRSELDQMVAQSGAVEVVEHLRRGDHDDALSRARAMVDESPDSVESRTALAVVLLRAERWAEAGDEIRDQLATLDLDDDKRTLHLNNLAWADLMTGDPSLLDEADRASAEAFASQPWRHAIRGTRGSVLVERGELTQGIELLRSSELRSHEPRSRASTDAYLAIALARSGNVWDARQRAAAGAHCRSVAPDAAPGGRRARTSRGGAPLVERGGGRLSARDLGAGRISPWRCRAPAARRSPRVAPLGRRRCR